MRGFALVLVTALLAAPAAFAGTATFSGSTYDTQHQLQGGWVSYQADAIGNPWFGTNPGGEAAGGTTNLATLCGTPSLATMGTITMVLTEPNWDWADYWWGAWTELTFDIGGSTVIIGMGSPYDWGDYGWVYTKFGGVETKWNQTEFGPVPGNEPLGIRVVSDGTNLSILATKDGSTFNPVTGASWPINNLPGGLGDLSSAPVSLEIFEYGPCSPIDVFSWTAPSVPHINPDSDGDGLADATETNTGVYVNSQNTGTNPAVADTDGDSFLDGAEVEQGSNPTDANSVPPTLPVAGLVGLGLLLGAVGLGGALKLRK